MSFFPSRVDHPVVAGDVYDQLCAAFPRAALLTTGECLPGRWVLVTTCHLDGSLCDWLTAPDERGPWAEGSAIPKCGHGLDCIFQPGLSGEPRIFPVVA